MTLASLSPQAALPSPSTAVWQLGPVPIRAYALCIVLGIIVAAVVTEYRLRRRGVAPGAVLDIAVWAVPAGIIGARIYHVITSPQAYFGAGGDPVRAFYIWEGGLGIWGAVAGGAFGAWLAARQLGLPLSVIADALAPGLPLAQAVGRFGNWFNNELFGGRTTLPWGLEVHRMDETNPGHALRDPDGNPVLLPGLYHPTFAYEAIWNVGVALLVYLADRRFRFGRGRAFALYVMGYTAGRFWIELMRTDEANHILGLRLNVWTAIVVFAAALVYFLRVRGPREYVVPAGAPVAGAGPAVGEAAGAAEAGAAGTPSGAAAPSAPDNAGSGGPVSQVDVSRRTATAAAEPAGYRVVTEEQYLAFQRTGEVPAEPGAEAGDAAAEATPTEADPVGETGRAQARATGDSGEPAGSPDLLDDFADDEIDDTDVPGAEDAADEDPDAPEGGRRATANGGTAGAAEAGSPAGRTGATTPGTDRE